MCIKKDQDSFGNIKYILSEYDRNVIHIVYEDNFLNIKRNDISNGCNKREFFDVDIYQHPVDYFYKECLSYSKPLTHEKDFFIFDYDEYKIRFHLFEDEEKVLKGFFNYINNLMFDENQIHNVFEYDIAEKSISDDPKQYMLDHCKKLKEIYKNDKEILMIVEAYILALEKFKWAVIDEKLWNHSKDVNNSRTFVSRQLKIFEKIAADNRIPFIAAVRWKNVNNNKESIVYDMLKQLKAFHADA